MGCLASGLPLGWLQDYPYDGPAKGSLIGSCCKWFPPVAPSRNPSPKSRSGLPLLQPSLEVIRFTGFFANHLRGEYFEGVGFGK